MRSAFEARSVRTRLVKIGLLVPLVAGSQLCCAGGEQTPLGEVSRNPAAVQRALNGQEPVANVAWWGFDLLDSTESIQGAIHSGAKTVIIPNVGRPWIVRPIRLASNQTIVLEQGVVIMAKENAFQGMYDCLFLGLEVDNVELRGYGAVLRMRKADYAGSHYRKSEFRHTLSFRGASNVKILGLTLQSAGGDGIYLGPTWDDRRIPCRNIEIRECICDDNHRQGISVISAEALRIEKCVFRNTDGTRPKAGLDLEPANARDVLQDIVIRDCVSEANKGAGFLVNLARLDASSKPVSILFDKCVVRSSYGPSIRAHVGTGTRGAVEFRDCECFDTTYPGLFIEWEKPSSATLRFVRCRWERVARRRTHRPLSLTVAARAGRVEFESCRVIDDRPRPFVYVHDKSVTPSVPNIHGDIVVISPHAAKLEPGVAQALQRLRITHQNLEVRNRQD